MKQTTIEVVDDLVYIKAPYEPGFNKALAARREWEIEEFERSTKRWVVWMDPEHYDTLEQIIYDEIGGEIKWL